VSGPRRGRRQLATLAEGLSDRDTAVLRSVGELRLMGARQLERLHFRVPEQHATTLTAARTARRTLERLVRQRLLLRLERRIGGVRAGSASFIYALGPVGERVLTSERPRRRFREPSAWFVAHTLAAGELYVRLHEAARGQVLHVLTSVETEPVCWRRVATSNGRSLLKPDLLVITGTDQYEYRWFVEVDLGTEHAPAVVRKCRTYEAYYRSGVEQAAHGVFPRVLWVTPADGRAERVRRAIERATDLTDGLFVVTTTEQAIAVLGGGPFSPNGMTADESN
jgi:hypothetical protein